MEKAVTLTQALFSKCFCLLISRSVCRYQVVHDFMAEAGSEGELTVWIGDIVEVYR